MDFATEEDLPPVGPCLKPLHRSTTSGNPAKAVILRDVIEKPATDRKTTASQGVFLRSAWFDGLPSAVVLLWSLVSADPSWPLGGSIHRQLQCTSSATCRPGFTTIRFMNATNSFHSAKSHPISSMLWSPRRTHASTSIMGSIGTRIKLLPMKIWKAAAFAELPPSRSNW